MTRRKSNRYTAYHSCQVERRKLVTYTELELVAGATVVKGQGWHIEPCAKPLFADVERARGVCFTCLEGWTHPENAPTAAGLATIAAAQIDSTDGAKKG